MGKISPFNIMGSTYSISMKWVHLFLPVALVTAAVGTALNMHLMSSIMADFTPSTAQAFPTSFWSTWGIIMLAIMTLQLVQLSLFESVIEQREGWLAFGISRALRRLIPVLLGMVIFMVCYMVGIVLLIIPGLMVLFLLYMMMPLILLDGVGPIDAVKKSWSLTWGNAWRLFGAIIITFLPLLLVFWIAGFALGMASPEQLENPAGPFMSWASWQTWAYTVLMAIIGMLATTFYLVAFKALKVAKAEGGEAVSDSVSA